MTANFETLNKSELTSDTVVIVKLDTENMSSNQAFAYFNSIRPDLESQFYPADVVILPLLSSIETLKKHK